MAAIRTGGSGGSARFTWQGATVFRAWEAQIQAGMEAEAKEVLDDLRASIHRWPHAPGDDTPHMADEAFAEVTVSGTKRTLRAGSDSDHAIYEEARHPIIRQVMDQHVGHITERIRSARGQG
jgi:hypothetical protein